MSNLNFQFKTSESNTPVNVSLLSVTSASYNGDWPSIQHSHYFTELFYVQHGHGKFVIDDTSFPIGKDDLIIINPNINHTEISLGSPPLSYISLSVDGLSFSFNDHREFSHFNCHNQQQNLLFYFDSLLTELENKNDHYEEICKELLNVLIFQLQRITDATFELSSQQHPSKECARIKRFLDAHYMDNISLDDLAEISHLNKFYLVHTFTKFYGIAPINYLNEKRLSVSKELLGSTDHCIADIAQLSGFASQSYFAQCFKKTFNMTAGAYRKLSKQNKAI